MPLNFTSLIGTQLWFPLFVIGCLEALAIYTWQFRKELGARWQSYGIVCKGGWLLALVCAQISTGIAQRMFWISVYQMLALLLSFIWFRFIAQISGFERRMPRWVIYILGGFVALAWLIILTNGWHGWYWKSVRMTGTELWLTAGSAIRVARIVAYLTNAFTVFINVRWALRSAGLRRRQAAWFLLPSLIVWFGHFMTILPGSKVLAPLPTVFLLSSALTVWAYQRWLMYGILSLAQDTVVKTMIDGLMVVDEADYIVEMNAVAKFIFQGLPVAKGSPFQNALEAWPALAASCDDKGAAALEASRKVAGSLRTFHVTLTPLRTVAAHRLGQILVFKDVTLEKQQQARIVEQQKALSTLVERQRLGRELHDGPGQIWSFLSMQAQAARTLIARQKFEQAEQLLDRLVQVVQEVHTGLRESINGLQIGVCGGQGLRQALEEQLQWYREHCDLNTDLIVRGQWQGGILAPNVEVQLLRILQEALANVRKSACANRVRVVVEREEDNLNILVEDDGRGFDPILLGQQTGHHGLAIMRERADEIGAQLTIESQRESGTRIRLQLSVAADATMAIEEVRS
jgi:signal transduction histidine kinase